MAKQVIKVQKVGEVKSDSQGRKYFTAYFVVGAGLFSETVHRNFWMRNSVWQVNPESLKEGQTVDGLELFQVQTAPYVGEDGQTYHALKGVRIAALNESVQSAMVRYGRLPVGAEEAPVELEDDGVGE